MTWTPTPPGQIPSPDEVLDQLKPEAGDPSTGYITPQDIEVAFDAFMSTDADLDSRLGSHAHPQYQTELRGTGSPEGVVAAPVGSIYTDTAATNGAIRWIKETGTGTTGWQVEFGDTGWRNLASSAALANGWALYVNRCLVRRIGRIAQLSIYLDATNATADAVGGIVPAGFQPGGGVWIAPAQRGIGRDSVSCLEISGSAVTVYAHVVDGNALYINLSYFTDSPWPTVLPGLPA